jgi:mitochondrial fission protein ELM1
LTNGKRSAALRIWAIIGARAGDNNQVIALAEALNLPFEIKHLRYNRLHLLGPRLLGHSLASLTNESREFILSESPPDLTISAGHRSVPVVQALRQRSGGITHSIHVGFPRVSPGRFDLVIATPQYPIVDHPNLLRVPFALTRAATAVPDPDDKRMIDELPAPHHLLVVGGPTLFWTMDERALIESLEDMLATAAVEHGSALVTTSPRTPASVRDSIVWKLTASGVPSLLAQPGHAPAYASLLETADTIRVTADSVAMVSDAIWTGKPVALVPVRKSLLGRTVVGMTERIRRGVRLYPQDLRFFWRALSEIGIDERLARPRTSTEEQMRRVLERVQAVLLAAHASSSKTDLVGKNGGRGKD